MEISEAKAYIERWQAVEKIEQKERQSATLAENWRHLNLIKQRAARLGIVRDHDDGEMEVFLLWARLKANYVPS
jgi:hypothetical protein